jgi:membrane peptidoglycan carboxypeptidase
VVEKPVLTPATAATIDQILQGVVQSGTGTAAALPGWQVAGKTGTTENYGDAWFVGFTPRLVVAVWVGYPAKLVSMTTEFHGRPVVGGTYPALIFKSFMEKALPYLKADPADTFPYAPSPYVGSATVVQRDGRLERDNGYCHNARSVAFYGGEPHLPNGQPAPAATCKPNEVEIPDVVGSPVAAARARLAGQPLTAAVVYKPAKSGDRVGYVVGQFPREGTASAHDRITLVAEKSLHGVVPHVVGLRAGHARTKCERVRLKVKVDGPSDGKVVKQSVAPGTAAAPGVEITLTTKP